MSFSSTMAAQVMHRAKQHDEALNVARQILAANPYEAEANLTVALVMFRRNAVTERIESLKKCLAARPAEWILERMRQDFQAHGRPPLQREMAFRMGAFFRSNLSTLAPSPAPELRRDGPAFINVVGTSYVRSF